MDQNAETEKSQPADSKPADQPATPPNKPAPESADPEPAASTTLIPEFQTSRYLAASGYGFLSFSVIAFGITGVLAYQAPNWEANYMPAAYQDWLVAALARHLKPLITLVAGCVCAGIGYGLLRAASSANRDVIPHQHAKLLYRLLLDKNESGLNSYIKLASLSGFVGFCTKLGIGGLPLATIALTVFFTLVGVLANTESFLDFAKLTLGAFIGSYVQGQRVGFTSPTPGVAGGNHGTDD